MHRCHALYPTTRTCITRFERRSLICAGLRAGPANIAWCRRSAVNRAALPQPNGRWWIALLPIPCRARYGCAAVPSLLPVQVVIGWGRVERIAMQRCHALYPTTRTCITRFERRSLICAGLRAGPRMLPGGVGQSCRLSQVVPFTSRAVLPIRFRARYGCAAVPSLLPVQVTIGRGRGERIAMQRCHALYPTTRTCITRFERRSLICAGLRAGPANIAWCRRSIVPPCTSRMGDGVSPCSPYRAGQGMGALRCHHSCRCRLLLAGGVASASPCIGATPSLPQPATKSPALNADR
ncbi:MAG: hypothetical protein KatS3mg056_1598 [Chloroflexus sp.]|nr:MAG: hypothetical protein KatS3mg056_1598 [Chloroflexus sp.]